MTACTLSLLLTVLTAGPAQADAADPNGPWGQPVDGLRARLILQGRSFCIGRPVPAVFEIQNVSKRTRYLAAIFDPHRKKLFVLKVVDPNGNVLPQSGWGDGSAMPRDLKPIAPGETLRGQIASLDTDLRDWKSGTSRSLLARPGRCSAAVTFTGSAVPRKVRTGERITNGQRETIYTELTDEQVAGLWTGTLSTPTVAFEMRNCTPAELTVHEWGVFTVYPSVRYANAGRRAEWQSLPEQFYRQFPSRKLRFFPAMVDKPIMYFHTNQPAMEFSSRVTFAEGAPVVWWPACWMPYDDGMGPGRGANPKGVFRSLTWQGWLGPNAPIGPALVGGVMPVKVPVGPGGVSRGEATESPMPEGCWVRKARIDGPALVSVHGSSSGRGGFGPGSVERERFLFYDGLVPAPEFLRCVGAEPGQLTVRNTAKFDLPEVFAFDRRAAGEGKVGLARIRTLPAGKEQAVEFRAIPAREFESVAAAELLDALTGAGLLPAEANSLVEIWREGFFHKPGVTVLHLLPPAEYDRMIRLEVWPPPGETKRVGVVLYPQFDLGPRLEAVAREAIAKLGDEEFTLRDLATKTLRELGPPALRVIQDALKKATDPEVKLRLEALAKDLDAADYLKGD